MQNGSSNANATIVRELRRRFPELGKDASLPGADAVDRLNGWLAELEVGSGGVGAGPSDGLGESARQDCINAARAAYCEGDDIEIDDDARLSASSDFVWVSAWVLLIHEDLPACLQHEDSVCESR